MVNDAPMEHWPPSSLSHRKRAYNEISQENDPVDSLNTTPQKRLKSLNTFEAQSVKESGVSEVPDDLKGSAPKSPEDREQDALSGSSHPVKESGTATSMNWNGGTRAKIRVSLGGSLRNASAQEVGKQENAESQSKIRSREIKKAGRRLDALKERLSTTENVNSKIRRIQKRIYEAEVDYNYCFYYPAGRDYQSLFQGQEEVSEIEDEDETGGKRKGRLHESKPPLWRMVERCMKTGKLEELKSGNVDENYFAANLTPLVPQNDLEPTTLPQEVTQQDLTGFETKSHLGTLQILASGKKLAKVGPATSQSHASDICKAIENASIPAENRIFTLKVPPELQNRSEVHESVLRRNPEPDSDHIAFPKQRSNHAPWSDPSPNPRQDRDSESDGGVLINLQTSEQESGEVSDTESKTPTHLGEDRIMANVSSDRDTGEHNEEEEGDAMMDYARSDAVAKDLKGSERKTDCTSTQNSQPLTLARLNPEDLKAQFRYFHTTKRSTDVDRNTSVRCLVCAQESHMADECMKLTCMVCGSYGDHFSPGCPQKKKCRKCRALDHVEWDCPYKLKNLARQEIICDLCQQNGHYEGDCELLWRTSGRPWESELMNKPVRLNCYECGKKGHLGNDCPTRRPGKASGTSTWSLHSNGQFTIKSQGEVTIKGRAQQQNPIVISDSDDDQDNFYRPRIPEPARKGQIRIMTGANQNPRPRQHDTYTPGGQSFRNNANTSSRGGGYWDSPRDNDYKNDPRRDGFKPRDQRSLSPRRSEPFPGRGNRNIYELPQRPEEPPIFRGGLIQGRARDRRGGGHRHIHHHPMPSAAQKAWSKHRA